jgi:hypothetical protein
MSGEMVDRGISGDALAKGGNASYASGNLYCSTIFFA